jgi:hypothetical protein
MAWKDNRIPDGQNRRRAVSMCLNYAWLQLTASATPPTPGRIKVASFIHSVTYFIFVYVHVTFYA